MTSSPPASRPPNGTTGSAALGPARLSPSEGAGIAGLAVLGVLVGWGFVRVFHGAPVLRIGLVAALGAAVVGEVVGRFRRRTPSATILVSLVASAVVAPMAVSLAVPSPVAIRAAVSGLADAPRRILSVPLPVGASDDLVVVAFFTVWVVVAISLELARRHRAPFLPLVPAAAGTAVPVLLAASGPEPGDGYWGLVLVAAAGVALTRSTATATGSIRSVRSSREALRRQLAGGLPILVAVAVVAPALGRLAPGVAGTPRSDARRTPVTDPVRIDSPLARVAAMRRDPQRIVAFGATGPTGVGPWRLAVLDRYDGTSWTASGSLVQVAEQFPVQPRIGRAVTFEVEIDETGTVFLPSPGRAVAVSGPQVRIDRTNGNVAVDADTSHGVAYTVTAQVAPQAEVSELSAVDRREAKRTGAGADARVARTPIARVARLGRQAEQQVLRAPVDPALSSDLAKLTALQDFLADTEVFKLAPADEPVSGESMSQLERLVIGGRRQGGDGSGGLRVGSKEQYVAAYAVMARSLGFASRVVVGYRPRDEGGSISATNRDIDTWAEVKLEGLGWIAFSAGPDEEQDQVAEPPPEPPTDPSDAAGPADLETDEKRPDRTRPASAGPSRTPWLVAAAALAGAVLVVLTARRPARRWRRRRGDARSQVLGAWAETVDVLARSGVDADRTRTVGEIAAGARTSLTDAGNGALAKLARLATRAAWSPAAVHPDAPTWAWRHVATVRIEAGARRRKRLGSGPQ